VQSVQRIGHDRAFTVRKAVKVAVAPPFFGSIALSFNHRLNSGGARAGAIMLRARMVLPLPVVPFIKHKGHVRRVGAATAKARPFHPDPSATGELERDGSWQVSHQRKELLDCLGSGRGTSTFTKNTRHGLPGSGSRPCQGLLVGQGG